MAEPPTLRGFSLTRREPSLDLDALLEGRVVLQETAGTQTPAPRSVSSSSGGPRSAVSPEVRTLLETTGLRSVLSEAIDWPDTLDKQIALLTEMQAEFQSALTYFREGVKAKLGPSELHARLAAVRFLGGRLSTALYGVTDGGYALAGNGPYPL